MARATPGTRRLRNLGMCLLITVYAAYTSVGRSWLIPAFFSMNDLQFV